MINGERSKASPFEFCQVIASLACIAVSISAIAMSVKQWSATRIELSYSDVLALREDAWLGIAREANDVALLLAAQLFVAVFGLAAVRRTGFHFIALAVSGAILIAAVIAWATLPRA